MNIRPLDLILFRGSDPFSHTIMDVERSLGYSGDFSHSAIVVTREILPWFDKLKHDKIYIWESTCSWRYVTDGTPDVLSGKTKLGVQIRDFKKVKKQYLAKGGTAIVHCSLKNNPIDFGLRGTIDILGSIYFKYGNKGYEHPLGLSAAISPIIMKLYNKLPKRENSKSVNPNFHGDRIFCSELVALVYQKLKLLDISVNPSNVLPCYFLEKTSLFDDVSYFPEFNDSCGLTYSRMIRYKQTIKEEKEANNIMSLKIEYTLN